MDSPDETIIPGKPFDPKRHLMKVSGKPYLEVKWRIAWVRAAHPDCSMKTELVSDDGKRATFVATVTLPTGGSASGWGQEQAEHFADYLEKAETKALGRALAALGFGIQFTDDHQGGAGDEKAGQPVSGRQRDQGQRRSAPSETSVRQAARAGQGQATPAPTNGQAPAPDQEAEATTQQLDAIHRLAAKHGLDQKALDTFCQQQVGQVVGQLSHANASQVIRDLQAIKAPVAQTG